MPHFTDSFFDTKQFSEIRSVARADVAELVAEIQPALKREPAHHLVVVSTKKCLTTTQFKQMFYSRGDDYFQIANVYECPDSGQSVLDSVWGIAHNHSDLGVAGDNNGNHAESIEGELVLLGNGYISPDPPAPPPSLPPSDPPFKPQPPFTNAGFPSSISINKDGNRVAIGSPLGYEFDGNNWTSTPNSSGAVNIFDYDPVQQKWIHKITLNKQNVLTYVSGDEVNGNPYHRLMNGAGFGYSVSLSDDGTKLAVGAPLQRSLENHSETGAVIVFDMSGVGANLFTGGSGPSVKMQPWLFRGSDTGGGWGWNYLYQDRKRWGSAVAISGDGTRVAISSSPEGDNADGSGEHSHKHFRVKVCKITGNFINTYQNPSSGWVLPTVQHDIKHDEIAGGFQIPYWNFGSSISLNTTGTVLAVGAPGKPYGTEEEEKKSGVFIWEEVDSSNWELLLGLDTVGDNNTQFGYSVSLNGDGKNIIVGQKNAGNGAGKVKVYKDVITTSREWVQKGNDLDGVVTNDFFGRSVSINNNGNLIAIGAKERAALYYYDHEKWNLIGTDVNAKGIDGDGGHGGFKPNAGASGGDNDTGIRGGVSLAVGTEYATDILPPIVAISLPRLDPLPGIGCVFTIDYKLCSWNNSNQKDQRVYNFNKLGGRTNDPKGTQWAYSYVHDNSRNMYAQFEVMGNLEKDTCVKRDQWTICSRMTIEDQLYGLAFAAEADHDVCMKVECARRWSEVEDALAESCLAAGHKIDKNQHVDLYINVRVTNSNPKALDTIFRIRFTVKYRSHYPSIRSQWNTSATKAASGVIQSGVVLDAPEGGKKQTEDSTVLN